MTLLAAATARNRRIGIALMCATTLCYSALDVSGKWLVMALPVVQVVWLRFFTHAALGLVVLVPRYGTQLFKVHHPGLQLLRGSLLAIMNGLNFWALRYLPLDVTGAIQFSMPILVAFFSARWLGERLDGRRWLAIAAGFGGVLLIVRPFSHEFHPAVLLSIGNAVLYAGFNMLTRRLAASELPAATQQFSAMVATVLLAPFGLWYWTAPADGLTWLLVLSMGVFGGVGHMFAAQAHRFASAAVLGPFIYQQIIYMCLFGWLVFGHVPDAMVIAGAAVVVASGLYLLYREFRQQEL